MPVILAQNVPVVEGHAKSLVDWGVKKLRVITNSADAEGPRNQTMKKVQEHHPPRL